MERSIKRRKLDFNDQITVVVATGPESKPYSVYKDVLIKSSDFFRTACKKEWKEGQNKIIELPNAKVEEFEIYLHWLYTGQVVVSDEAIAALAGADPDHICYTQLLLVSTYLLADMLLDSRAKNALVDTLLQCIHETKRLLDVQSFKLVDEETTEHSPLRRLLVDKLAFTVGTGNFKEAASMDVFPAAFLVDVSVALMEVRKRTRTVPDFKKPGCAYHEHDEENPKCT